jgi:hypothetical protein
LLRTRQSTAIANLPKKRGDLFRKLAICARNQRGSQTRAKLSEERVWRLDGLGFAWATSGRSATGRRHARPAPTAKCEARWEARITAAEPPELAATLNLPISPGQLGLAVHCEDAGWGERITTINLLCVLRE